MSTLIETSKTSWKQPFKDRKREFKLWRIPSSIVEFCNLKDKMNYRMNIRFEAKFNLNVIDEFHITSGREIYFRKELREKIEPIILSNPDSYFEVTILDRDKATKPKKEKK
jgi:putative restriction endonuclease